MANVYHAAIAIAIGVFPPNIVFARRVVVSDRGVAKLGVDEVNGYGAEALGSFFEEEEEAEVEQAPRFAADSVLEFEVNKCTLLHMEAFQRGLSACASAVTPAEAVDMALQTRVVQDLVARVDGPVLVSSEDEADILSALSVDGVEEDEETIAMCVAGSSFVDCVKHLHPPMWLTQRWEIMNLLGELTDEPARRAFAAKLQIYRQATHAYGFAFTRTRNICREELNSPMEEQVRVCILNDAVPDFLTNPNSQFSSVQNVVYAYHTSSLASEEGYDMSNSSSRASALRNWLLQYFRYRDEQYAFTQFAMRGFQRQCQVAIDTARAQKRKYKHAIQGTYFSIHRRARPYCEENVQSPIEAQSFLHRMSNEVTTVCDPQANCTERPGVMAPEGFACDMRRAARQGRNLALGSTAGAIAGLALVLSVPVLGVGVVGLVAAEGVAPAAFVAAGLAFPGKGPAIVAGAALGSQELTATCMAFPLICHYSPKHDRCEVVLSEQQGASSPLNPFSSGPDALPFTGFKCVPDGEEAVALTQGVKNWTVDGIRHAAEGQTKCSQKQCTPVDAVIEGPRDPVTGVQLFGRVGFLAEDGGVYNCLNTNSSTHSFLPYLDALPDPSSGAGTVENSADNRAQMLRRYIDGQ